MSDYTGLEDNDQFCDDRMYDMRQQPAYSQYKGCGRAWVAIKDGQIVAVRYMNDHSYYTGSSPKALARANRKRCCKASINAADDLNREAFLAWRKQARRELAGLGDVISGMMSGNIFNRYGSL